MIGITSRKASQLPFLESFLESETSFTGSRSIPESVRSVAGWGARPSGRAAERLGKRYGIDCLRLEDGFLRSFGAGEKYPPLSLIADKVGIYYDATRPSELENLLNSDANLLFGIETDVSQAHKLLMEHKLSKYNFADKSKFSFMADTGKPSVLVVDQTKGDLSIELGLANEETFEVMLEVARAENPEATLYIKTHPEVISGKKRGHLSSVKEDEKTILVRKPVCPMRLLSRVDRVYVVSSQMGFEGLLNEVPVSCFGMPWYAGWGVTDDRMKISRRTCPRSVRELFAAAYFHYIRYLDPVTRKRGSIFDVIGFLLRQKEMAARYADGRTVCIGFPRWKQQNILPFLSVERNRAIFTRSAKELGHIKPTSSDRLVCWGADTPPEIKRIAVRTGASLCYMEDGFIRSVGLGSDLIPPRSLVLDETGLYFDPTKPSALEETLNNTLFKKEEIDRAVRIRKFIADNALSKYNLEQREATNWENRGQRIILVPGQVQNDASIRLGCDSVNTNLGLLEAARANNPDAFIVYKPHPDVSLGKRPGQIDPTRLSLVADYIEERQGIISCIEGCDAVHTMTSLAGFDALIRGKQVTVFGRPFYAGWGLTEDHHDIPRRTRILTLDELVAGTLIRYPLYWDPELRGFTSCEAVLHHLRDARDYMIARDGLKKLNQGYLRRQARKLGILYRSLLHS
jgi:capsular polysaccharide export protein